MYIDIDKERLRATVVLDSGEADNPEAWKNLQPMINEYKRKDYLLIIREAGTK